MSPSVPWGRVAAGRVGTGNVVEVGAARAGKGSDKALKPACAVLRSSSAATRVLEEYGIVTRESKGL